MDDRLFDFLNRQQVYVEGVKNWHVRDFNRYLKLLADGVRAIMAKLGIKMMGELTKARFNNLLQKLFDKINSVVSQYGTEFLQNLRQFTRLDIGLQKSVFTIVKPKLDLEVVKIGDTWKAVSTDPVPAFGETVKEVASGIAASAKNLIKKRTTTAFADNETVADATAGIVGTDAKYTDGVLKTLANQVKGFITSSFQHATSTVTEALGKIAYPCYQWCSVMDNHTSEICRDRNGRVYRYGDGPQPPAHPNCRSRTVPCECDDGLGTVPSFFSWLKRQTAAFLSDAFGGSIARKVKEGTLTADDLGKFNDYPPLSLDDFGDKGPLLTA